MTSSLVQRNIDMNSVEQGMTSVSRTPEILPFTVNLSVYLFNVFEAQGKLC